MTREELVEAGSDAAVASGGYLRDSVAAVVDAVEPLIRADEQLRHARHEADVDRLIVRHRAEVEATAKWCREDERATIRAQVKALPKFRFPSNSGRVQWVRRKQVLALFDWDVER